MNYQFFYQQQGFPIDMSNVPYYTFEPINVFISPYNSIHIMNPQTYWPFDTLYSSPPAETIQQPYVPEIPEPINQT